MRELKNNKFKKKADINILKNKLNMHYMKCGKEQKKHIKITNSLKTF
jgi:hypothetical protein